MGKPLYKRVLLKVSGEALMGEQKFGLDPDASLFLAQGIQELCALGIEVSLVIGGGNIFRAVDAEKFNLTRVLADQMGMLATAINGLLLEQGLLSLGVECAILSAFKCKDFFEAYNWRLALEYLDKKKVLILVGGTGRPYFTTDTAAALCANELGAEALLKATKVDGIYDKDPLKFKEAKKFTRLTYSEALVQDLKVMDATAFALCKENKLPIYVFNLFKKGALKNAVCEQTEGTLVT
jgi:uridylate kinase